MLLHLLFKIPISLFFSYSFLPYFNSFLFKWIQSDWLSLPSYINIKLSFIIFTSIIFYIFEYFTAVIFMFAWLWIVSWEISLKVHSYVFMKHKKAGDDSYVLSSMLTMPICYNIIINCPHFVFILQVRFIYPSLLLFISLVHFLHLFLSLNHLRSPSFSLTLPTWQYTYSFSFHLLLPPQHQENQNLH